MTNALTAYSAELAWRLRSFQFERLLKVGQEQSLLLVAQVKAELLELDIKYRRRLKALLHDDA